MKPRDQSQRAFVRLTTLLLAVSMMLVHGGHLASAQTSDDAKKKARDLYERGEVESNLGNFDTAIKHFTAGYRLFPNHLFLFNIAQAHRQKGDCEKALVVYKRFLSQAKKATKRRLQLEKEVQDRIPELEASCRNRDKPPVGPVAPDVEPDEKKEVTTSSPVVAATVPETKTETPALTPESTPETTPEPTVKSTGQEISIQGTSEETKSYGSVESGDKPFQPATLVSSVEAGPAFLNLPDIEGALMAVRLGAGYPLYIGELAIDVGGLVELTPVPWTTDGQEGTALLSSILGNVGASYRILDSLAVRAELGFGAQNFSGLVEGNAFTTNGYPSNRPLTTFNVRAGLGVSYAITDHLLLTLSPAVYSFSPAPAGLDEEITSLARFEMLAGLGFRK